MRKVKWYHQKLYEKFFYTILISYHGVGKDTRAIIFKNEHVSYETICQEWNVALQNMECFQIQCAKCSTVWKNWQK